MIDLLARIGRAFVVVGAFLTIAVFAIYGGLFLPAYFNFLQIELGSQSEVPLRIFGALVGGVFGLIFAGITFGSIALLYSMNDKLAILVRKNSSINFLND